MQEVSSTKIGRRITIFCAQYLLWIFVGVFCIYCLVNGYYVMLFGGISSGVLARGLNEVVHIFYKRKRPQQVDLNIETLIATPKNLSFPSGHASFSLGISFFLLFLSIWWGVVSILLSLVVFMARVASRVHWKTDILGSLVVALISTALVFFITNLL